MRTRTAPDYLTKFPIAITQKQHNELNPRTGEMMYYKSEPCHDFITKYGYFAVDKAGNINFIITLVSIRNGMSYTIKVAKQYLYDSLLINLEYKPVVRKTWRNKHFYVHNNIGVLLEEAAMKDLTPPEIKERFEMVKDQLGTFIVETTDETKKRTAELQSGRLIAQQWKMELLHSIYMSEVINKDLRGA